VVAAAVFDNLHALGRIDRHFQFAAKKNLLVGHKPDEEDSQFEVRGGMQTVVASVCFAHESYMFCVSRCSTKRRCWWGKCQTVASGLR
jgi:hypothetical protein